MKHWWFALQVAVINAAIQPPPWADPVQNPCSAKPGGWLKLYWPEDGQCYRIFQTGPPCPETMELSPGAGGAAECRCAPGHVQMHAESQCYKIFTRGPCLYGQYVQPMRDDIRGRWGTCKDLRNCKKPDEYFWPESKQCYEQFTRGPCAPGQLFTYSNSTGLAECGCDQGGSLGKYFWPPTKSCHQFYTRGPCLEKGALFLPGPLCACHAGLTNFYKATGQCYELGSAGPCKSGQIFTENGCTCKPEHVPWPDGHCYRAFTRGPCTGEQLLSLQGTCMGLPCPRGKLYFPKEDACHRVGVQGPCPRGQLVLFEQSARPAIEGISYRGMCGMTIGDGVPETVTEELVQKIWRKTLQDESLTISKCDINLVGGKGDNYSSIMCRASCTVKTDGKSEEKSMVIKTFPVGEFIQKYVKESNSFEKETKMLQDVLPEFENILRGVNIDVKLGAKVYFSQTDPYILAMEDLSNFSIAERFVGLCLEECVQLAESLAMFHAASMIYLQNNPDHEFFRSWIWGSEKADTLTIGIKSSMETIIKDIDNWSDQKWAEKLQKRLDTGYPQLLFETVDRKNEKRPMVLNHGDLWLNNIMFNHGSAKSPRLRFVDLQLSWKNSPVFDLIYFLFTSPRAYVRFNRMDTILEAYHTKFTQVTKKLGLSFEYSFQDLKDDFKETLILGFAMFHFVFPIMVAPRQHALDNANEKLGENGEAPDIMKGNPIFDNEFFRMSFLSGLQFFEDNGIL